MASTIVTRRLCVVRFSTLDVPTSLQGYKLDACRHVAFKSAAKGVGSGLRDQQFVSICPTREKSTSRQ
eukprot:715057-Amphidinium_carterae.1